MEAIINPILNNPPIIPEWLTLDLQYKVKQIFEPRYGRFLSDSEVLEISMNLVSNFESLLTAKRGCYAR